MKWAHLGYGIQLSAVVIGGLPLLVSMIFSAVMVRRLADPRIIDHLATQKRNSLIVLACLIPFLILPKLFALDNENTAIGAYVIFGSLYTLAGLWLVTQIALGWYRLYKGRPARKAAATNPTETLNEIDHPETNRNTKA